MPSPKKWSVLLGRELAVVAALLAAGCGSSSSVVSAPSPTKCTVATTLSSAKVGADGGSGRATVTANPECAWASSSEAAWVVITEGQSGQGDGSISYQVAANPSPVARTASIAVNDQRVALTQDAAPCRFTLDGTAATFDSQGGTGSVAVTTASGCEWTAMSGVPWISIRSGSRGVGSGTVTFTVAGSAAETRRGEILIAGHTFTVDQNTDTVAAPGCTASIGPTVLMVPARGAVASVNISTPSGCRWTATSATPWLMLRTDSGVGDGSVQIDVGANAAQTARTGTATIAGRTVTVQQAGAESPPPPPPACM